MTISSDILDSISTPEQLETLEFTDGVPSRETVETVYDHLDFVHALNVFLNAYPGASTYALRKGFHEAGANDNEILIFSELMGSESLFMTANAEAGSRSCASTAPSTRSFTRAGSTRAGGKSSKAPGGRARSST